jgi:hypothetical protein
MLGQIMEWSDQHHPTAHRVAHDDWDELQLRTTSPWPWTSPRSDIQPTPKTHQIVFAVGCSSTIMIIYPILVALRVLPILKGHHHLLVSAPFEKKSQLDHHSRYVRGKWTWSLKPPASSRTCVSKIDRNSQYFARGDHRLWCGHGWASILPDIWDVSKHVDCQNSPNVHLFSEVS